jgi:hypothetical protein
MFEPVFLVTALVLPQVDAPQSQPSKQPSKQASSQPSSQPSSQSGLLGRKPLGDVRQRLRPAKWGRGAPGRAVMPQKVMPIVDAPYTTAAKVAGRVSDRDLVIGLVVQGRAFAYPIKMLGGPSREIINEEYGGVPFCVNW